MFSISWLKFSFFKYILLIMLLQLSHFSPFIPLCPATPLPSAFPPTPQFNSIGCKYKFFGFSISYTILNLPLSLFYLPFMLLILCIFPPLFPSHSPTVNRPCDLHFCDSVPVLIVCLVCLGFFRFYCYSITVVCICFCFRCGC